MKMNLKLILDIIIFIAISIIAILIKYGGIQPYHRGFYCFDSSIKYPYKVNSKSSVYILRDFLFQSSTVSSELALAISVLVPCLYITSGEVYLYLTKDLRKAFKD